MPFIACFERIGYQRGLLQRGREDVIEVLAVRFADVPISAIERINAIEDPDVLKTLHQISIEIPSLSKFQDLLSRLIADDEPFIF
ncbi:hypothetical protein V0288_07550 [Pannus brasiliensis CCIBt3594]|uniref:Uncharacterized protein n=1 Tax=Pannus brasiliensis CCIBt3594 TaxID=1427578 RepID=A0AAW9QSN3_9CHRO